MKRRRQERERFSCGAGTTEKECSSEKGRLRRDEALFVPPSCREGRAERVAVLSGFFERLRGLKNPAVRDAASYAVLVSCHDVHTFGMAFPLDIAFVDHAGVVIDVRRGVAPSRRLRCRRACLTLERIAEDGAWFEVGESVFRRVSPHERSTR